MVPTIRLIDSLSKNHKKIVNINSKKYSKDNRGSNSDFDSEEKQKNNKKLLSFLYSRENFKNLVSSHLSISSLYVSSFIFEFVPNFLLCSSVSSYFGATCPSHWFFTLAFCDCKGFHQLYTVCFSLLQFRSYSCYFTSSATVWRRCFSP